MSRGLGKVQKAVIECLEIWGDSDYGGLIEAAYGDYGDNKAHMAAVSRAVGTLEKKGLVTRRRMTTTELDKYWGPDERTIGFEEDKKMVVLVKR